jgi:hypothetical protein
LSYKIGAPDWIRTSDLCLRRAVMGRMFTQYTPFIPAFVRLRVVLYWFKALRVTVTRATQGRRT